MMVPMMVQDTNDAFWLLLLFKLRTQPPSTSWHMAVCSFVKPFAMAAEGGKSTTVHFAAYVKLTPLYHGIHCCQTSKRPPF